MSVFIVDLRQAIGHGLEVRPIPNMVHHETNELFFDRLEIPAENLIGEEGKGFRYLLDGLNAERTLIAAECIGDGYWFIDRATKYANERVVFDRPIGRNQGVQFPIAEAFIEVEAANLMRWRRRAASTRCSPAARRPTWPSTWRPRPAGKRPTCACRRTAASASPPRYDVERKFRETRLYQVAPISTNMIYAYVAEHVLGLPRSFDDGGARPAPLDGITVVALEHAIAAPFCTRQLADLGRGSSRSSARQRRLCARLRRAVKGLARTSSGPTARRSLTLDVKHPDAQQILAQLLQRADVLVQNLAPGAAARLGLSFEALHAGHPGLIVCDISGYGDDPGTRPVPRQEGLRPADPERVGLPRSPARPTRRPRPAARSPTSRRACMPTAASSRH